MSLYNQSHGHAKGGTITPTYRSWAAMHSRCRNPSQASFGNYGARGITVCAEWSSFSTFLAYMGARPLGHTLDRKNNNAGYSKANCHWATRQEQNRNTRASRLDARKAHQIRWLAEMGYPRSHIGRMYGVTKASVNDVVRGRSWA